MKVDHLMAQLSQNFLLKIIWRQADSTDGAFLQIVDHRAAFKHTSWKLQQFT